MIFLNILLQLAMIIMAILQFFAGNYEMALMGLILAELLHIEDFILSKEAK